MERPERAGRRRTCFRLTSGGLIAIDAVRFGGTSTDIAATERIVHSLNS
jgi:Na+/H+ antiporter NhaB